MGGLLLAGLMFVFNKRQAQTSDLSSEFKQSLLDGDTLEMKPLPPSTPEFDSEHGFPVNAAAKTMCVRQWTDANTSELTGESEVTRINYTDLQSATNSFEDSAKVGVGGSCSVFKAELYGMPCAIKVLSQHASPWEVKQFVSEVDMLARVKHPNICQLYAR
jgi:hypothetical protein